MEMTLGVGGEDWLGTDEDVQFFAERSTNFSSTNLGQQAGSSTSKDGQELVDEN